MAKTERAETTTPWPASKKPAIKGVRKTPRRFDAEALHNAAGTLPPATEVKAIEACTVEGSVVSRISRPRAAPGGDLGPGSARIFREAETARKCSGKAVRGPPRTPCSGRPHRGR